MRSQPAHRAAPLFGATRQSMQQQDRQTAPTKVDGAEACACHVEIAAASVARARVLRTQASLLRRTPAALAVSWAALPADGRLSRRLAAPSDRHPTSGTPASPRARR